MQNNFNQFVVFPFEIDKEGSNDVLLSHFNQTGNGIPSSQKAMNVGHQKLDVLQDSENGDSNFLNLSPVDQKTANVDSQKFYALMGSNNGDSGFPVHQPMEKQHKSSRDVVASTYLNQGNTAWNIGNSNLTQLSANSNDDQGYTQYLNNALLDTQLLSGSTNVHGYPSYQNFGNPTWFAQSPLYLSDW